MAAPWPWFTPLSWMHSRERRDIDPAPLAIALIAAFGQLHVPGAFEQARAQGHAVRDVTEELLPARAITVLEWLVVGHFLPLRVEVHRLRHLGVPHLPWGRGKRLHKAFVAARDRRAERAVDLDLDEVVALHARGPRGCDLRQRAALELEGREHLVLDIDVERLAGFVPARLLLCRTAAR